MEVRRTIGRSPKENTLSEAFLLQQASKFKGSIIIRPQSMADAFKRKSNFAKNVIALNGDKIYLSFEHIMSVNNGNILKQARKFLEHFDEEIIEGEWILYKNRDFGLIPLLNIATLYVYFGRVWNVQNLNYLLRHGRGIRTFVFHYKDCEQLFHGLRAEEIDEEVSIIVQPFYLKRSDMAIISLAKCDPMLFQNIKSFSASGGVFQLEVSDVLNKRFLANFLRYNDHKNINIPHNGFQTLRECLNLVRSSE